MTPDEREKGSDTGEPRAADRLFATERQTIADFDFGPQTAEVFDDMLERSVPFYAEMQRMMFEMIADFAIDGTRIYDLGCSTGRTLLGCAALPRDVTLVGIDNSQAMLDRAALTLHKCSRPFELHRCDLEANLPIENASVVILSLTLQFMRPLDRPRLIEQVYRGLNRDGCLIVIEKILAPDSRMNRLFIKYYYNFKRRNGYSDMEIAQKREALENVLIPYFLDENAHLLKGAGFQTPEVFFKWNNFAGLIAVK